MSDISILRQGIEKMKIDLTDHSDSDDNGMEISKTDTKDSSRRRLFSLKSVIKGLLFVDSGSSVSSEDLKEKYPDMKEEEIATCLLIVNKLMPYIPLKRCLHHIIYQLPLTLLANDILRYTGYQKFTQNICPLPSLTTMNALRLDGPSLCHVLSRAVPYKLHIFDYDNYVIESEDVARRNQDATFSSIFDMTVVRNTYQLYGLKFAHSMIIQPGLTTVRLLGTKKVQSAPPSKKVSYYQRQMNTASVIEESKKSKANLQQEIEALKSQIVGCSTRLKEALKKHKEVDYSKEIKQLKPQWKKDASDEDVQHNGCIYSQI
ncbi:hypothetical protein RMATCC62417_12314 [Rhizopus microsporus]|nr:hypothetical protein RMATCC62417_12314 [Rhizopus microsporus]